jgi:lipoprotein signal peptidase
MNAQVNRSYRWLFWGLVLLGLSLDQVVKYGVFAWMYDEALSADGLRAEYNVIPGAFDLQVQFTREQFAADSFLTPLQTWGGEAKPHVNRGALYGVGNDQRNLERGRAANRLFAVISTIAALAILWWSRRPTSHRDRLLNISLGLILAGTLGNLYDRLVFDGVRDCLYWYFLIETAIFNVADFCLICGAGLLLLQAFISQPQEAEEAVPQATELATAPDPVQACPGAVYSSGCAEVSAVIHHYDKNHPSPRDGI